MFNLCRKPQEAILEGAHCLRPYGGSPGRRLPFGNGVVHAMPEIVQNALRALKLDPVRVILVDDNNNVILCDLVNVIRVIDRVIIRYENLAYIVSNSQRESR